MPAILSFFDVYADTRITRNRLPHWEQDGRSYFVTIHLADSLPAGLLAQWHAERQTWLKWHPEPWTPEERREYHQRFSEAKERWLDAMHGACLLRASVARAVIVRTIAASPGIALHSAVVMPNHLHALFSLRPGMTLGRVMQEWKSVSARQVNRALARSGTLWMKDYFDRLVRNPTHFWNCARYIRRNPAKAKLPEHEFTLLESDWVRAALAAEEQR